MNSNSTSAVQDPQLDMFIKKTNCFLEKEFQLKWVGDNTLTKSSAYIDKLSILQFGPGECNPGHIRSVVCKVDADPDILRGFLNCLEQQDICGTLEHLKTTDVSVFSF